MHPDLIETLRLAQRLGFFGARPIEEAVAHSQAFVTALGPLPAGSRVVDIGSGGGLPGLVVAAAYPGASILLVDRRTKRTDFLRRAAARLGFEHVDVRAGDVTELADEIARGAHDPFDVVTARGFGPPEATLRTAVGLLARTGRIVISEPPVGIGGLPICWLSWVYAANGAERYGCFVSRETSVPLRGRWCRAAQPPGECQGSSTAIGFHVKHDETWWVRAKFAGSGQNVRR